MFGKFIVIVTVLSFTILGCSRPEQHSLRKKTSICWLAQHGNLIKVTVADWDTEPTTRRDAVSVDTYYTRVGVRTLEALSDPRDSQISEVYVMDATPSDGRSGDGPLRSETGTSSGYMFVEKHGADAFLIGGGYLWFGESGKLMNLGDYRTVGISEEDFKAEVAAARDAICPEAALEGVPNTNYEEQPGGFTPDSERD